MWWAANENLSVINILSCSLNEGLSGSFGFLLSVLHSFTARSLLVIESAVLTIPRSTFLLWNPALESHLWHVGTSCSTCFPNLLILSCFFQIRASCTYPDAQIRNFVSTLIIPCIWLVLNFSLCFPHLPSLEYHCLSSELLQLPIKWFNFIEHRMCMWLDKSLGVRWYSYFAIIVLQVKKKQSSERLNRSLNSHSC